MSLPRYSKLKSRIFYRAVYLNLFAECFRLFLPCAPNYEYENTSPETRVTTLITPSVIA